MCTSAELKLVAGMLRSEIHHQKLAEEKRMRQRVERGNDLLLLSEVGDDSKTAVTTQCLCPAQTLRNPIGTTTYRMCVHLPYCS